MFCLFPGGFLVARDRWRFGCSREHFWKKGREGAGVNERQMQVVPTQLFSQSSSKARRTGCSTGNLRWVLPLFAVARRLAQGWKCLRWGTTSKPFSNINFLDSHVLVSWLFQFTMKTISGNFSSPFVRRGIVFLAFVCRERHMKRKKKKADTPVNCFYSVGDPTREGHQTAVRVISTHLVRYRSKHGMWQRARNLNI